MTHRTLIAAIALVSALLGYGLGRSKLSRFDMTMAPVPGQRGLMVAIVIWEKDGAPQFSSFEDVAVDAAEMEAKVRREIPLKFPGAIVHRIQVREVHRELVERAYKSLSK